MSKELSHKAVKDVAGLFGAQLSVQAMSVFLSAWLIHQVPADDLALWPLVIGIASIIVGLSSLGLGDYLVRVVPKLVASGEKEGAGRVLRTGLLMNVVATVLIAAAAYVYAEPVGQLLLRKPGQADVIRLLLAPSVLLALGDHLQWAMRSLDMLGGIALLNLLSGGLRLPMMVGLFLVAGTRGMVAGIAFAALVRVVFPVLWLRRWLFGRALDLRLVAEASPYYGAALASLGVGRARYLLISALGTPAMLAAYFVAEKIADLLDGLSAAVTTAAAPKLSMKVGESVEEYKDAVRKAMRYFYWAFVPVCALLVLYARPLMRLYGGPQYAGDFGLLAVLAGSYLFRLPYGLLYEAIKVACKPVFLPATHVVVGGASIALLAVGVSVAKAWGAAASVVVAHMLGTVVAYAFLKRGVGPVNLLDGFRMGAAVFCLAVLFAIGIELAGDQANQLVLLVAAGVAFAAAYLLILRGNLMPSESRAVWALVPGRLRAWPWVRGLERVSFRYCTGQSEAMR